MRRKTKSVNGWKQLYDLLFIIFLAGYLDHGTALFPPLHALPFLHHMNPKLLVFTVKAAPHLPSRPDISRRILRDQLCLCWATSANFPCPLLKWSNTPLCVFSCAAPPRWAKPLENIHSASSLSSSFLETLHCQDAYKNLYRDKAGDVLRTLLLRLALRLSFYSFLCLFP